MSPTPSDPDTRSTDPRGPSKISRKGFLGAAGAGAAAAALGGVGTAEAAATQEAARVERTDVVVVGAGMGGLTAAVRAQEQGADVVLLEKASEPGGTMRESEGVVWTYGSYDEIRANIPDGDPDLQRTVFDMLPTVYEFYEGLRAPISPRGGDRSRQIAPVAFTNLLVGLFQRDGGTLLVDTPMVRLLTNPRHEVIGVLADSPDGPVNYLANAVILATGGWAGNAAMVNHHITRHFGSLYQRNCGFNGLQPALTGDGYWAASAVGAAPSQGGFDSFYGHVLPARPARFTHPLGNYSIYHGQWTVTVNLEGVRFTDESRGKVRGRDVRAGEQIVCQEIARQPEATAAYIWDEPINQDQALAENNLGDFDKFDAFRDAGAPVARANSLEELADQMERWGRGIPASRVLETIREYNGAAENGRAWALPVPKGNSEYARPIDEPPFYAVLGTTGITGPHGGLKANTEGQILSRGGRPIPGLYAAGIDIGGIGNYVYMGFLCYGAVFGYIAGANAAAQPEPAGGWEISPFA
ncbi:MAG: FAD-dependent oxidoreductase [Longimicrobiales bacterium]|nr:FAD-dependent oxidoreductase [Longimicrobiales bacterium]